MKNVFVKTFTGFSLLVAMTLLLLSPTQSAIAQTDPEGTPQNGYLPPATPTQLEEAYPGEQPPLPTNTAVEEGYVAPTQAPTTAIIGSESVGDGETAVSTIPISQSAVVRNRAILWAGFLITLLIFLIAVYGAMLMYTRRRN